jgi:hypothetical protein
MRVAVVGRGRLCSALRIADGDAFRAFSLVATPGGFTEHAHDQIFAAKWRSPGNPT